MLHLIQEKHAREIVFKAMGQAISKTVAIAEILKVVVLFKMFPLSRVSFKIYAYSKREKKICGQSKE